MKIQTKITIIVVENKEPYYFLISKYKQVPSCLFFYQMLASNLTIDEWPVYYKVYGATFPPAEIGKVVNAFSSQTFVVFGCEQGKQ